jgi:hypothetical protein
MFGEPERAVVRVANGERRRIRMLIPLWGPRYYERWLSLAAPALLAPGNMLHLHERADFELAFLCKSEDLDFLNSNAVIRQLAAQIRLKTITIDEFFPPQRSVSYGVPLTLAYAKGIEDFAADGLGGFVILLNADFVLSAGSLAQVARRLDDGFHIVTAPSLRVVEHEVRSRLEERLQDYGVESCFLPRAMMAIAERYLHQTVRARIINSDQPISAWYYHLVYWRISDTCLAGRSFLLMPLCFQIRRAMRRVICPVDYGFIEEYCPGGRYAAIGDSDELLMIELQARDSESELLEIAPRFESPDEALDYRLNKLVANAGQWSAAEHRRAFAHTLLFHSTDPPTDLTERLAEFDRQMADAAERLPPPISAVRHFQWLAAVQAYAATLTGDGVPFVPRLLDDDANRAFETILEIEPEEAARAENEWPPGTPDWKFPAILADAIGAASTVVTLDGLVNEVWTSNPAARIFPAELTQLHGRQATILLPPGSVAPGSTIAVYLLTDSLPHWPKVKQLCDASLASGAQIVVIFRHHLWASFDPQHNSYSWMLSRLEDFFCGDYVADIKPIPAKPSVPNSPLPWHLGGEPRPCALCYGFMITLAERRDVATAV